MGLDSGINIYFVSEDEQKNKKGREKLEKIFEVAKHRLEGDITPWVYEDGGVEVAYWRKFWGLRNDFIFILRDEEERYGEGHDGYTFTVTSKKIDELIDSAKRFLNRKIFDLEGQQQIWDYDEYHDVMTYQVENLKKLKKMLSWLDHNGYKVWVDYQCYFYDSY